jgi:hypothetical protein
MRQCRLPRDVAQARDEPPGAQRICQSLRTRRGSLLHHHGPQQCKQQGPQTVACRHANGISAALCTQAIPAPGDSCKNHESSPPGARGQSGPQQHPQAAEGQGQTRPLPRPRPLAATEAAARHGSLDRVEWQQSANCSRRAPIGEGKRGGIGKQPPHRPQAPTPNGEERLRPTTSTSIAAPDARQTAVKLAASMARSCSASLHRGEWAAKAINAAPVGTAA